MAYTPDSSLATAVTTNPGSSGNYTPDASLATPIRQAPVNVPEGPGAGRKDVAIVGPMVDAGLDLAGGALETIGNGALGLAGSLAGGAAGWAGLAHGGPEEGQKWADATQKFVSSAGGLVGEPYQTKTGKFINENVMEPIGNAIGAVSGGAGQAVMDATGSPGAAAITEGTLQAIPLVLGAKAPAIARTGISAAGNAAGWVKGKLPGGTPGGTPIGPKESIVTTAPPSDYQYGTTGITVTPGTEADYLGAMKSGAESLGAAGGTIAQAAHGNYIGAGLSAMSAVKHGGEAFTKSQPTPDMMTITTDIGNGQSSVKTAPVADIMHNLEYNIKNDAASGKLDADFENMYNDAMGVEPATMADFQAAQAQSAPAAMHTPGFTTNVRSIGTPGMSAEEVPNISDADYTQNQPTSAGKPTNTFNANVKQIAGGNQAANEASALVERDYSGALERTKKDLSGISRSNFASDKAFQDYAQSLFQKHLQNIQNGK